MLPVYPRDHVLALSYFGQNTQTTLTSVSVLVRVNGGAATTYTSVTTPAVAVSSDCTFAYHLEIPAASFNDGDRVSFVWEYSGTAFAYDSCIIGPAAVDGAALSKDLPRETHPRDHILALAYQGTSAQTDVTKMTCKVRVNGGAATTYTNVSTPAIAQATDCTFAYHLEIPASTYADGDRVSRTWLYNAVAVAYGDSVIGPAAADETVITAIKAKTDTIGTISVTVTSPAGTTGAITVFQGDDYKAADARQLEFTSASGWPSLTGSTVIFKVRSPAETVTTLGTTTVISATDVRVELSHTDTAGLSVGTYNYSLIATLTDTDVVTLATGTLTVEGSPLT